MSTLDKVKNIIATNTEHDILYKKWDTQHRDEYFSKVYWHYHPSTEKYFFEANPSFLHEYKNMFDCGRFPIVMLRDGFVGVLEFFLVHPTPPKDFRSVVLINKKFAKIIPVKWKGYVATYVIASRGRVKHTDELLLIYGFGTEDIFWKESSEKLLAKYADIAKNYKQTVCLFPQRESLLSSAKEQAQNHALSLIRETYRSFGFDAKLALDFNKFFASNDCEEFSFLSLDQSSVFVADSYFEHYMFRAGGHSLNKEIPTGEDVLEYNLSANHKVVIEDVSFEDNLFAEFYIQFKVSGEKNLSIYKIFQSKKYREMFLKYFSSKA